MTRRKKILTGLSAAMTTFLVALPAYAQGASAVALSDRDKWIAIAAGLGIAIAAFGGALGQGRTAATALDGIARNPGASGKIFAPMLLGLALIETLVIYSLIIAILLVTKIGVTPGG
jgi:F-type H+-transporting ATPase subunit c